MIGAKHKENKRKHAAVNKPQRKSSENGAAKHPTVHKQHHRHAAEKDGGDRADKRAADAPLENTGDRNGDVEHHFRHRVPAGLPKAARIFDDLIGGHPGGGKELCQREQQHRRRHIVVGVANALCVDLNDRQQEHAHERIDYEIRGDIAHFIDLILFGKRLAIHREKLTECKVEALDKTGNEGLNLCEKQAVDGVNADGRKAGNEGKQQDVGVVEHHRGDLMQQHRVFLRDSAAVGGRAEIEPAVLPPGIHGDIQKLQHRNKAVGCLHQHQIIGEQQDGDLAEAAEHQV